MNIVVFGATGSVGTHIIEQALSQGHQVTAFTRNPDKFTQFHENLRVVKGDVLDQVAVKRAITDCHAVMCALGKPLMNKEGLRAKGTKVIIKAMQEIGVKRLICLSGFGAGDSWEILPFRYKYLIFPLFMRRVYSDHEQQESYVKASKLDWVIARASSFTKGKHTGIYRHGFTTADKSLKIKISHADVADFMLQLLGMDKYLHKTPAISY